MIHNCAVRFRLFACSFIITIVLSPLIYGQEGPDMTWGKVGQADLQMKTYLPDTNASAVVLFDYGEAAFNENMGLAISRHTRIKILTKEGYAWGTVSVTLHTANHEEEISGIAGCTYIAGPDGKVQRTEFDDDGVFKEDVDKKFTRYRFTLPSLQPGCVIEYRYTVTQKSVFFAPDWEFQSAIPELWSEFQLLTPKNFAYTIVRQGYEKFYVDTQTEEPQNFSGAAAMYVGQGLVFCNKFRLVLKDAPAIREEPFMTTTDDYIQRASLQLAEYATPYTGRQRVMKTWEQVVQELVDDDNVGKAVDVTKKVRRLTEPLIANLRTSEEKMQAIYDYVRSNIVWSGMNRCTTENDVDDVLEARTGSSAEITAVLLSMLRVAGFNGCPVILSTRGNGRIQDAYPILSQFNYSLACVPMAGRLYFLDATDRFRSMQVLPTRVLNTRGLLIREGPVEWVTLSTSACFDHTVTASLALSATGELCGTIGSVDNDYAAIQHRKDLKDGRETEVLKKMLGADRSLIAVDSVRVEGLDSTNRPLVIYARINSPTYAEVAGDFIYLNPFVVERQFENPFKLPVRKFPVDMMYPRKFAWDYTISLPEGYDVTEIPQDRSASIGDAVEFSRSCKLEGRTLSMHAACAFRQSEFSPRSYASLKGLYEKMTSYESDQVVLKRHGAVSKKGAS